MTGGLRFRLGGGRAHPDAECFAALDAMCRGIEGLAGEAAFTDAEAAWFARLTGRVTEWSAPGAPSPAGAGGAYRENLAPTPPRVTDVVRFNMMLAAKSVERMMQPEGDTPLAVVQARRLVTAHVVHACVTLGIGRMVDDDDRSGDGAPAEPA